MSYSHNQIIACAAILLAATILRLSPSYLRKAFFVLMFGTGLLAAVASIADTFANAAVASLFG
ncbi:MAG TPA: hypothetical protein VFC56_11095 [Stellaceae bacterium]|nr:hypothetical protein [Stellaceae bacterium]